MNRVGPGRHHDSLLQFAVAVFLLQTVPAIPGPQHAPPAGSRSADTQTGGRIYTARQIPAPVPIYHPAPKYSAEARRARYQGTAVLMIVVDASGNVTDARMVKPLRPDLDANAIECVRTWKYKPTLLNGIPVPVRVVVEVSFQFEGRCRLPIALANATGKDSDQLAWGQFPEEAFNLWSQKSGPGEFPQICSTDPSLAKYAVVSKKSSHSGATRSEVYQLAAGNIQHPALFISKDTTSATRAFKEALQYLDRETSQSQ